MRLILAAIVWALLSVLTTVVLLTVVTLATVHMLPPMGFLVLCAFIAALMGGGMGVTAVVESSPTS